MLIAENMSVILLQYLIESGIKKKIFLKNLKRKKKFFNLIFFQC